MKNLNSKHGRILLAVVLFPALTLTSSCAKRMKEVLYAKSEAMAIEMMNNAEVTCTASQCHDSVGMIAAIKEVEASETGYSYELGQCTATLIAPDAMVTNSHCIPDVFKKGEHGCDTWMKIHFPETAKFPKETAGCSSISFFSEHKSEEQDIAVIKLSSNLARPYVTLDYTGIKEKAHFDIYKIDPHNTDDNMIGRMAHTECTSSYNGGNVTAKFSEQNLELESTLFLTSCDRSIIQGNSGSSLLSDSTTSVGVLQATRGSQIFGSNFACSRIYLETGASRSVPASCKK